MKEFIVSRRIDQMGRIVLPINIRNLLGLKAEDLVDIFVDTQSRQIILRKPDIEPPDITAKKREPFGSLFFGFIQST